MSGIIVPSYSQGFARYKDESEAPEQWKGLVAAWPIFLGPTGMTLHDPVGKHNGILTNMDPSTDWLATVDGRGNSVYALDFDGSNDYVDTGDTNIGSIPVTITAWIYPHDLSTWRYLVDTRGSSGTGYFYWNRTLLAAYGSGTIYVNAVPNTGLSINVWQFVTYSGGAWNVEDVRIGDKNTGGEPWDGLIGEVRIYNRALSAAEIWQQFTDPYAMWRLAYAPLGKAAVAGMPMPLLMQQMNQFDGGAIL